MKSLPVLACALAASAAAATLALVVPREIQMPGTQPLEVPPLEDPAACMGCHGFYDTPVEPGHNWQGSMMAHAARDPLFWAAMAVAEQAVDGAGDLCLRCHTPAGWMDGRSTPTDGSALVASDGEGVSCDVCHNLVNPDTSEHPGVQNAPYEAHTGGPSPEGYVGSAQMVLYTLSGDKLGPYAGVFAGHGAQQSQYHRSPQLCGTCHDVSNPLVGDLAHNNGAQLPLAPGTFSGMPGGPLAAKAAFNNFPHAYGIVERTFSEHQASAWGGIRVRDLPALPRVLQAGLPQRVYEAALAAGNNGDYEDGAPRYFSCQSCHMPPVTGQGCIFGGSPVRADLPLHDLTGGNYWMPDAILYLDSLGQLQLGGGLTGAQQAAMLDGKYRAMDTLEGAASLELRFDTLRVVNLAGHKLISGYPEGRRMWLNVRWFDGHGVLIREDGAYGPLSVMHRGAPLQVETLLDPADPHLHLWQAHMAITQEWAVSLLGLGLPASLPLAFDRTNGTVLKTLGQLAAQAPGTWQESFQFVLNNLVAADNRIPPYGFRYDEARVRNALPVPATQYGDPGPGGVYRHWAEVDLDPPQGARRASIRLMIQPTSWEYVQFLDLANDGSVPNLALTGARLLDAWLNTGMAAPHVMAEIEWSRPRGLYRPANPQSPAPPPGLPGISRRP